MTVFSRASRTLRGATRVGGPIADQSESVMRASVDCSSPTGTPIEARPYTARYSSFIAKYSASRNFHAGSAPPDQAYEERSLMLVTRGRRRERCIRYGPSMPFVCMRGSFPKRAGLSCFVIRRTRTSLAPLVSNERYVPVTTGDHWGEARRLTDAPPTSPFRQLVWQGRIRFVDLEGGLISSLSPSAIILLFFLISLGPFCGAIAVPSVTRCRCRCRCRCGHRCAGGVRQ